MEEIYPHFIVDKPLGEDFFEGQSQSKLAENISYYIQKVDDENTNKERDESLASGCLGYRSEQWPYPYCPGGI